MSLSVQFRGNSFDVNSHLLEIFLLVASLHLQDAADDERCDIRDNWLFIAGGHHCEILSPLLDAQLTTDALLATAVDAVASALAALRRAPPLLEAPWLNLLLRDAPMTGPVETAKVIEAGESMLRLLTIDNIEQSP